MRFPLAATRGSRRRVKFFENLVTGERHVLEWGGARLRIDQQQDPAVLFRCFT
jgi:starch synthase (maltosyl-transferring)